MNNMKVNHDGNGGFKFSGDVQKTLLKRYGIIGVLVFGAILTGSNVVTSKLVNDVSYAAKQAPVNTEQLNRLDHEMEALDKEVIDMRTELRQEIADLRKSVDSLRDILLEERQ